MKTLLKLAMGAAIAGALVTLAMRQSKQRRDGSSARENQLPLPYADNPPRGETGFTLAELAAGHTAGADQVTDDDIDRRTAGEGRASEKVLNS